MTKKPQAPPAPKPAPQQPQDSGMAYDSVQGVNPQRPAQSPKTDGRFKVSNTHPPPPKPGK